MKSENGVNNEIKIKPVFSISQGISVLFTGLGIGWLAGLSVSAVAPSIIASLMGLSAGLVTGLQSIHSKQNSGLGKLSKTYINAWPVALLVIGISIGAPSGILIRTYHVLEPAQSDKVNYYTDIDSLENKVKYDYRSIVRQKQDQGVLFSKLEDECSEILTLASIKNYSAFMNELKKSNIPGADEMVMKYKDKPEELEFLIKLIYRCYIKL